MNGCDTGTNPNVLPHPSPCRNSDLYDLFLFVRLKNSTSGFSGTKGGTLGEALPLIMTRLCEPKEASYILIKKYLEQHFPQLNIESRSGYTFSVHALKVSVN